MLRQLVRLLAIASALLAPTAARADPTTLGVIYAAFSAAVGPTIAGFVATYGTYIVAVALSVYGASSARREARNAAERQRAQYNANLIDRLVTSIQPDPAWRVVYGRCITGGDIVAIFTSDKQGTRPDGTSYTKPDALKHLVIHVATHEVEAINDVLIDGVRIGKIDANGWVESTSSGTGTGYAISSSAFAGAVSIPVASGTGTILAGDEISFTGDSTRYPVVTGITGAGQTVTIASPGLLQSASAGTAIQLGNEFAKIRGDGRSVRVGAGQSVTLPDAIVSIISSVSDTGTDGTGQSLTVTLSADRKTITNPGANGVTALVSYTIRTVLSSVRIRKFLGSATQTADSVLMSMFPTKWTANHRLQGVAGVVITLDLEEQRFQGGPPQLAFDVSGRKVFDPRSGLTAFSSNNALCTRDFLTSPWGFECVASDIDDAYTIAAANVCDAVIVLQSLRADFFQIDIPGPRYTLNGAFTTSASQGATLDDMAESMAGYVVYGAQWMIIPGSWTPSVMDLVDDDLDGQISIVQAGAGSDTLFNGARASYLGSGRTAPSDMVPYQNQVFKTADGVDLWSNYTLPFTDSEVRARNLCRIFTERNRDGQIITYPAKLKAWPLRVGDRVRVTSAEYGFTQKYYRVTDWQFGINSAVNLTLQEDGAAVYDTADAVVADPSPNTDLPNPYVVPAITGLAADSGTTQLTIRGDGTVVPRVKVTWSPVTASYITPGGRIEVSWQLAGANDWAIIRVSGDDTSAYLTGVADRTMLTIRVVLVNSIGARSDPTFLAHRVVGKTAPPGNVTGLTATLVANGVQIAWSAIADLDYASTKIHNEAVWVDATTSIFNGRANSFVWPYPPTGNYTFAVKHRDSTGNESLTASTVSITVTPAAVVAWINVGGRPIDTTNMILTPTFDSGSVGDWGTSGSVVAVAGQAWTKALQSPQRDTLASTRIPVRAGDTVYSAADLDASGTTFAMYFTLVCYTSADVQIATVAQTGTVAAGTGWTRVIGSGVVPANTAYVLADIVCLGTVGFGTPRATNLYFGRHQPGATYGADWGVNVVGAGKPSDYATSDLTLIGRGNCVVRGNSITKVGGGLSWDSDAYSTQSFTGGAYCSFRIDQNNAAVMGGLNSDPLTDQSYASIDFAFYGQDVGTIQIFENGAIIGNFGTYNPSTVFTIIYNGVNVRYFVDGVVVRTVAAPGNLKLYFDSSFYNPGASASFVRFGPLSGVNIGNLPEQGQGGALNSDPGMSDITAWNLVSGTWAKVSITDGVAGATCFQNTNVALIFSRPLAIAQGKTYRVSVWARSVIAGGQMYLRLHIQNGAGAEIAYNIGVEGVTLTSGWVRYTGFLLAPSGSATGFITIDSNYNTTGVSQYQDFRLEEVINTDLLANNAATEMLVDTSLGFSASSGLIAQRTLTFIPPVDCLLELAGFVRYIGVYPDAGNQMWFNLKQGAAAGVALQGPLSGYSGTTYQDFNGTWYASAIAGQAQVFTLMTNRAAGNPTMGSNYTFMRITAVKK